MSAPVPALAPGMLATPVALIVFNRPATTQRVFARIADARPRQLFVIADGPRPEHPEDVGACAAARAIADRVTWPCAVMKNYADANLGCGRRPATGISWVFEHVDRAIILEDDAVPHPTFFRFCDELLETYKDDPRVMMIGGYSDVQDRAAASYHFGYHHANCGGWATWRRAWQHFDLGLARWPALRETRWLHDVLGAPATVERWRARFDKAHAAAGRVDYWDYQWSFALWAQHGLAVTPNRNLLTNIGFGEGATHTFNPRNPAANRPSVPMPFPLVHPPLVARDEGMDRHAFGGTTSSPPDVYARLRRTLRSAVPASLRRRPSRLGPAAPLSRRHGPDRLTTVVSAVRHVVKHLRRQGVRRTAALLVNRCIYGSQEFVITRVNLGGPPADAQNGPITYRLAAPPDLDRLGELERYDRRGSIIRGHVEEDGDWLFVACDGHRIVATRLVSRAVPPHGIIAKVVTLAPGQVWGGEVFCVPEYRGKGIARHLSLFGDRYLASLGHTEILGVISATNVPSLRMHLHKGVRFVCHVSYSRLLFHERLRISREIPGALTAPTTD